MNNLSVVSDFNRRNDYRLLSIDPKWLQEHSASRERHGKRPRSGADPHDTDPFSIAFVMKGNDSLCLHSRHDSFMVRRVEYSNILLLAERRLNQKGVAAALVDDKKAEGSMAKDGVEPSSSAALAMLREQHDNFVFASLHRIFEANPMSPQCSIVALLRQSYLTLEEIDGCKTARTVGPLYSFQQLALLLKISPDELANDLQRIGAVMHCGKVRLLQPSLVYDALQAVLSLLVLSDADQRTWTYAASHFCPAAYPPVVMAVVQQLYSLKAAEANGDGSSSDVVEVRSLASLLNIPAVLIGLASGVFCAGKATLQHRLSNGDAVVGMPLDLFLMEWSASIPAPLWGVGTVPVQGASGWQEKLMGHLQGYVVMDKSNGVALQGTAWWLPHDTLTDDFSGRLALLFELQRQRWDHADLKAYMAPLLPPDQTFEHIMHRYAREYRIPGEVVRYSRLAD